jgi:hypothetical protein
VTYLPGFTFAGQVMCAAEENPGAAEGALWSPGTGFLPVQGRQAGRPRGSFAIRGMDDHLAAERARPFIYARACT